MHGNEPIKVSKAVRDWLNTQARLRASDPTEVWNHFTDFMGDNYDLLKARGYSDADIENLPIADLIEAMTDWVANLNANPVPQQRAAS